VLKQVTEKIVLFFSQLFKGMFYYCEGENITNVRNKSDCISNKNKWVNRKYNFDDLGKALMSLFVLSSRDGWVNIMYTGLDAVGVDQQVSISVTALTVKMMSLPHT
jgi:hypothetical protein